MLRKIVDLDLPQTLKYHNTRISKLENLNINQQVSYAINEQVSEAVSIALEAPLRSRFKDLPIDDMKVILQHSMYVSNQHKEHEAHIRLYEALESSILQDNAKQHAKDMEIERKRKRRRQSHPRPPSDSPPHPPLPPPPSGSSGPTGTSRQPGGTHSRTTTTPPPPSSKKQHPDKSAKSTPSKQAKQVTYAAWTAVDTGTTSIASPTNDDAFINEESIVPHPTASSDEDEDDASTSHIPQKKHWWKSFTRSDSTDTPPVNLTKEEKESWWKPDAEHSLSPEPNWAITSSDQMTTDNNWANSITTSFVPPSEDSLLAQTGNMGTFIE